MNLCRITRSTDYNCISFCKLFRKFLESVQFCWTYERKIFRVPKQQYFLVFCFCFFENVKRKVVSYIINLINCNTWKIFTCKKKSYIYLLLVSSITTLLYFFTKKEYTSSLSTYQI